MTRVRRAVIIGAGIAGPACALALAGVGIEASVVEAHPGPADGVGAILTLAANGLEALRVLGVEDSVKAIAQAIDAVEMSDGAGHVFARHPGGGDLLSRDELARVLAERAEAAGIPVHYGRRFIGASQSATGVVATFDDGSTVEADLLVGADGIHSTVRTEIDPTAPGPVYEGVLGFGAATRAPTVAAEPRVMNFAFGRTFLGYWRLPDARIGWFASLPRAEQLSWREIREVPNDRWLAELRQAYAGHHPGAELMASTLPDDLIATGPTLRMPPVPHWYSDRMVLVGDAVHAPSSSSGQGAALALESALELARCLGDDPNRGAALAEYEAIRRPRVEAVAAAAEAANRVKAGGTGKAETP
ncbi:MAG: 2-polyprenyl-6-methoxyphenol hydroxylase [Microbacteriaceae bacterium]|jgi:2-polyprenyl-6-methoxyphenol hydroxylase-like FAD-dependent oxidoreductase|nr:2-polyprenyl-6-methoxyphenol hydroxylase [Microbacteriaceae bacterium]